MISEGGVDLGIQRLKAVFRVIVMVWSRSRSGGLWGFVAPELGAWNNKLS